MIGDFSFVLDDFSLGTRGGTYSPQQFYIGRGFATIRNFTQGQDSIQLRGTYLEQFLVFPINNNRDLAIQTSGLPFVKNVKNEVTEISRFDTLAVIERGGNLSLYILPETLPFRALLV